MHSLSSDLSVKVLSDRYANLKVYPDELSALWFEVRRFHSLSEKNVMQTSMSFHRHSGPV